MSESERVALLQAIRSLEAEVAPSLLALTRSAAALLRCPMASLNLVDAHQVWTVTRWGHASRQHARALSPCDKVIRSRSALLVADAALNETPCPDIRDATNQAARAYAGVPLMVEGLALGTLCVYDTSPRNWLASEQAALADLVLVVGELLASHLASQRLRLLEARVRAASLTGSDWLWETNEHGQIQWVSASLVQHTGLDPATEIGLRAADLYTPRDDDTLASWQRFLQARQQRAPFSDAIAERNTPRGRITVSISGTPVFDALGQFKGYRGASRNVTRQIAAEHEARRADMLLRQAIESFQVGVMISAPDGRVMVHNSWWLDNVREGMDDVALDWPDTVRALYRRGAYASSKLSEDEFLAWRLALHERDAPLEIPFKGGWLLIKDQRLHDGSTVHFAMDISRNKHDTALIEQKQRELEETEGQLKAVLHALPDLWLVFDAEGRYLDAHTEHPALMRPFAELKGRYLGTAIPAKQAALQREAMLAAQRTGQPQRLEYSLTTRDGVLRHFEARMTPMPDGQTLFLTRDMTDRQVAADKLRVSEELYRSVAASISDGLLIVDLSGRAMALNLAACRILAVEEAEVMSLSHLREIGVVLLKEDAQTPLPQDDWPLMRTIARGERVVDHVMPIRRREGDVVWLQISSNLLQVEAEAMPFAAMASFRDITQERQAVQALASSEERWKFALDGAGDGVWDWDVQRQQVFFSPQWKHLLGYADHELPNDIRSLLDLVHPDDAERVRHDFAHYLQSAQGIYQSEFRMQHKQGHHVWILSRGKVVSSGPDGQPLRLVGTHSDVTLFKQAERALREKQSAEAASTAKSAFLSRMSHEIRTPLNAVNGFAQLLQLKMGQTAADDSVRNYVSQIGLAGQHLMGLVNDVLDLQQVEAGILSVKLETLSLTAEVTQCTNMLAPLAASHRVTLVSQVQAEWLVMADAQRLRQVIMNIGSNAIKYNRQGGVVRFDVEAHPGGTLALTVEDTGPGLDQAQLARLFQPFERLGRETSSVEGTGLGLIITRSLLDAMGGDLDIKSQPGCGTRVSITLPLGRPALPPPDRTEADCPTPAPHTMTAMLQADNTPDPSQALRVLYVEDNRINAMLFEEALRPYGQIELDIAEDGQSALSIAQEKLPHVLVLDAHLPGMSGFDVLKVLRKLPGMDQVPAYMCSADAMPEDVARAKAEGFTGYWTKPIDIVEVTTELCRLAASSDNPAP
jgi:PAS domain S-box-containing protein